MITPDTKDDRTTSNRISMSEQDDEIGLDETLMVSFVQWEVANGSAGNRFSLVDFDGRPICSGILTKDGPADKFYPIHYELSRGIALDLLEGTGAVHIYKVGRQWTRW
ncbi:MAG: hypothetical protein HC888_06965 [Candidatus Competibacteraceae bacterium]|nr:hypothetical protein [Candidatus Competibacteraceae bacterium]